MGAPLQTIPLGACTICYLWNSMVQYPLILDNLLSYRNVFTDETGPIFSNLQNGFKFRLL